MLRCEFLQAAATVAGATAGDVPEVEITAQQNRLLELADRDDEERWEYETTRNLAHVQSGLVNAELDALCDNPNGIIQTHIVGRGGIPLGFEVSTDDDEPSEHWRIFRLSRPRRWLLPYSNRHMPQGRVTMQTCDARVTARIVRTKDGKTFHEYEVGGVSYPSVEAVEAVPEAR